MPEGIVDVEIDFTKLTAIVMVYKDSRCEDHSLIFSQVIELSVTANILF